MHPIRLLFWAANAIVADMKIVFFAIILALFLVACASPAAPPEPVASSTRTKQPTFTPSATFTSAPTITPAVTSNPTATHTPTAALTSSPTPTPAATPIATITPAPTPDAADPAHGVWRLINQKRAQNGLPTLVYNDDLALAAQRHAEDCAQRGYGSHIGSDGADLRTRLLRAGYRKGWGAESWAWARNPQRAVVMWLDETPPDDPHRRMLLSPSLKEVGVGVAPGNSGGYYFIADFGR